jgi:hypothetical protein
VTKDQDQGQNQKQSLRDSVLILIFVVIGCWIFGGANWAIGAAASGLLAIANFFLLGMMVQRMVANRGNALVGLGFALKFIFTAGLLMAMVSQFEPVPVLVGFGVVLFGITIRGVLALPTELPEGAENA